MNEGFHFIRPLWLCLIPLAAFLWWQLIIARDPLRNWRTMISPELLAAIKVDAAGSSGPQSLILVFWLLACIAIAGPTWQPEPSPFADDPAPVMLILKVDATMEQSDLAPSRLKRAQLKIVDYTEQSGAQPVGLLAYAGSAHLVLPPTQDSNVVASLARELSPAIMPEPGDALAEALEGASQRLEHGGSLVILADRVDSNQTELLKNFADDNSLPVIILAMSPEDSADGKSLSSAAGVLDAKLISLEADDSDIRQISKLSASVAYRTGTEPTDEKGIRWRESGWWLIPVLMLLYLSVFRRARQEAA